MLYGERHGAARALVWMEACVPEAITCELLSHSRHATLRFGEHLGRVAVPGDLILLYGDLGAGKTTLTQGIARGLGIDGAVNSPTFTLIKEHAGRLPLFHIDLYRLGDVAEVEALGVEDYLDRGGVCVVEWADRGDLLWPDAWLRIDLRADGEHSRCLTLSHAGARGKALCDALCGGTPAGAAER
jgi:tRNA threonylcarbamoyladenosine biosynthesis protein TsaE